MITISSRLDGASTMPPSSRNLQQPGSVVITGFEELSSLFSELQARSEMAEQIKAFEYNDEEEEVEEEAEREVEGALERRQAIFDAQRARCNSDITYVLEQITQRGQLTSFKSNDQHQGSEDVEPRPEGFWNALASAAPSLQNLSLRFTTHELHKLRDMTLFPTPFGELLNLHFDLTRGHGDDASQVHRLLHGTPKLTSLSLLMPSCDLETCRLQGITYDYDFPNLASLNLYGWLDSRSGLLDFFLRHPSITTLCFHMESDDNGDLKIPVAALPNLRALAIDSSSSTWIFSDLLSSSTSQEITHLFIDGLDQRTLPILAGAGQSLRCLELRTYNVDEWREDADKLPVGELLLSLPELLELSLDCPTGNTTWRNEAGEWVKPAPIDAGDLRRLLSSFPPNSKIRAVRMYDERGLPLPADLLADLSDIAPPSLEYIQWDVNKGKQSLFKLEKTADGRLEAKECEPVRPPRTFTSADAWTSESIFDHVN